MAITKRVIVLEQDSASPLTIRYVLWADVPVSRQAFYAFTQAGMTSAWKQAVTADNTALQTGAVAEFVDTIIFPSTTTTLAQAEAALQAQWNIWQNFVTNNNPWLHYGSWMGITNAWTLAGAT